MAMLKQLYLDMSTVHSEASFFEWAFAEVDRPVGPRKNRAIGLRGGRLAQTLPNDQRPIRPISLLHVCIAAHQFAFFRECVAAGLKKALPFERYCEILRRLFRLPLFHCEPLKKLTPIQFAVDFQIADLLAVVAEVPFPADSTSPIQQAAHFSAPVQSFQLLVRHGASLGPIWHSIRDEFRFRWLLCLILDTFFEQGLRCRARSCCVSKLSSPYLQTLLISFLWRGLKRPSAAKILLNAIGERHVQI